MPIRFPDPPSAFTGAQLDYLRKVAEVIRTLPAYSYASLATPNSTVTGVKGDRFVNLGSASTWTREWQKTGPDDGTASTTSWVAVRILG